MLELNTMYSNDNWQKIARDLAISNIQQIYAHQKFLNHNQL